LVVDLGLQDTLKMPKPNETKRTPSKMPKPPLVSGSSALCRAAKAVKDKDTKVVNDKAAKVAVVNEEAVAAAAETALF
jgi:hypothetical protein